MKKIVLYIPFILISLFLTSCLEHGLEELPAFSEANITKIRFEYRWTDQASEYGKLKLIQLPTEASIDTTANTVNCKITVPSASDKFPESERSKVTISNIAGYADLSTAAILKPLGDAPVFGTVGDFSKSNIQYEVEAADGTTKTWTLVISEFKK